MAGNSFGHYDLRSTPKAEARAPKVCKWWVALSLVSHLSPGYCKGYSRGRLVVGGDQVEATVTLGSLEVGSHAPLIGIAVGSLDSGPKPCGSGL